MYPLNVRRRERSDHAISDALHRSAIDRVVGIEAESEMVDGLVDADVLRGGGAHDLAGQLGIVCWQIAGGTPRYALSIVF